MSSNHFFLAHKLSLPPKEKYVHSSINECIHTVANLAINAHEYTYLPYSQEAIARREIK